MSFENINILPASDLTSAKTEEIARLRNDITIGIEPGVGEMTATAGNVLTLDVTLAESNPQWVEMCWIAGSDILCRHPYVVLRMTGTAEHDSWFHPALRLHRPDGFQDVFPNWRAPLGPELSTHEVTYDLSLRQVQNCTAIDLQIFFQPRHNSISIHSLSLTAFQ